MLVRRNVICAVLAAGVIAAVVCLAPREPSPPVAMHAEAPRSGKWPKVRAAHLAAHPCCEVCGKRGTKSDPNEVHHVVAFHTNQSLELDPTNLITLCRDHHLLFGHLDRWASWNKEVREDAIIWRKKIENRP